MAQPFPRSIPQPSLAKRLAPLAIPSRFPFLEPLPGPIEIGHDLLGRLGTQPFESRFQVAQVGLEVGHIVGQN